MVSVPFHPEVPEDFDPARFRSSAEWKRLVAQYCVEGVTCSICHGAKGEVLFGLRPRHPLGPSLDHVVPLDRGGHPTDPGNLAPAHFGCNSGKRDREQLVRCTRGWTW